MPWFPVDDRFHSHPKAAAASLAAIGLWTVAGSWAREHLRDGDIPEHVIPSLSRGATELADELVACGLWRRTKAGYRFHQWLADGDGSPRNSSRSEAIARRDKKSSGGSLGNHRRWHAARGVVEPSCAYCQRKPGRSPNRSTDRSTDRGSDRSPNPPIPYPSPSSGSAGEVAHPPRPSTAPPPPVDNHARELPPRRCDRHRDHPDPPACGACADARRAHDRWQADQQRADQQQRSADAHQRAQLRQADIDQCDQCDQRGYLPSGRQCRHQRVSAAGAAAAARAAITQPRREDPTP